MKKPSIEHALHQAIAAHKEGRLQEAERLYRAILRARPNHPDANHNLGVLAVSVNRAEIALPLFRTAIAANPNIEQFWFSCIDALIQSGQLENAQNTIEEAKKNGFDAEKLELFSLRAKGRADNVTPPQTQLDRFLDLYRRAEYAEAEKAALVITEEFPNHESGWKALGSVFKQVGKLNEAVTAMQRSVQLAPKDAESHSNLGVTLNELGRFDEAEAAYNQAIALKSDSAIAHYNLGVTLKELGKVDEALASYNRSIALEPDNAEAHSNLGVTLKDLGRLNEAEASYTQAIALKRDYAEAHCNLGNLLQELGRLDEAEASYKQAIALKSGFSKAHYNLGVTLKELGRVDEALVSYNRAIALEPDSAEAHCHLGNAFQELGRLDEAEACYTRAIVLKPDYAEAYCNLGNALQDLGRLDEAEASYNQAIAVKPSFTEAYSNLGNALNELGRLDEAEAAYNQAIALKSDSAIAHYNLGVTLKELGRVDEALASYNRAIALEPDNAEAHSNLGVTLKELGRLDEAEASCRRAIALKPDSAEAHCNLGNALQELGRLDEAEASYNQAIALKPSFTEAYSNLGSTLKSLGRVDDALASYNQAIALDPDFTAAISNLLFLQASAKFSATRYLKDAERFSDCSGGQVTSAFSSWNHDTKSESLRVGFVSGDFTNHPVGYFLEEVLAELRLRNIELYAYPTRHLSGETTERIRALFHVWTPISDKTDQNAAAIIHNDGIHILIDLSGHTDHNRLPVFGWRPAPIQISWLGYFASTGLPEIDYIVGDPFVTPIEETHHFIEKIWRLPESYLCFTPPTQKLAVKPLPALSNGFVTFGCFNNISKMTDEVISVRADILHNVPNSRLFLKDKQFDYTPARDRVMSKFAAFGVETDRLLLEGKSSRQEYLACYDRVDIALSPFPYGGGTTSVEGLWMGVPVICKKGHHFLSHLGESIAHNSGLSNWIAVDNEDYVGKAIEFSSDLKLLESLRAGLRDQLVSSPLFDQERFSNHFAQALFKMRALFDERV